MVKAFSRKGPKANSSIREREREPFPGLYLKKKKLGKDSTADTVVGYRPPCPANHSTLESGCPYQDKVVKVSLVLLGMWLRF